MVFIELMYLLVKVPSSFKFPAPQLSWKMVLVRSDLLHDTYCMFILVVQFVNAHVLLSCAKKL